MNNNQSKKEKWALTLKRLKEETLAVYLAAKDPRVSWFAKILALCIVGYAFSPIDLIPDFIPILGQLDDLIIIPLGIFLVLKLIPEEVMNDCRILAKEKINEPTSWLAGIILIGIWLFLSVLAIYIIAEVFI